MRKIWIVLMLLVASGAAVAQNKGLQLDSLVRYYATEDNYNGVVFVAKGGNILLNKAYGYKNVQANEKHTPQSIFQIGSLTKQFTAEVILYFVQDKKIKLSDNLSKFFPGYPNGDRIKIEHLLSHSSGIYDYTHDSLFAESLQFKPVSKETMLSIFRDKPIDFEPGSKFAYSNSNYVLLGYIIEKITGKDYAQVVKDIILKPAGMKNTGFDFVNLKDKNKSVGYDLLDEANSVPAPTTDYTASYSAGAMYTTVEDLYAWHKALQSYRFIPKELQEKAYTPYNDRYGFGWLVDTVFDKRILAHSGGISGFTAYILRVQEDDLCIIMLENNGNPATDNNNMMLHMLSCLYSDKFEMPISKPPVVVDKKILESYVGTYLITPDFSLSVSLSGSTLYIQGTGQPKLKMVAQKANTFYSKVVEATIEFVKERDGSISKLILHQSGRDIPATRKN